MLKAQEISGKILLEEQQRFPKWLTYLMVAVLVLVLAGMILLAIYIEEERGEALIGLAIAVPIELAIIYLFITSELELAVTSNGVYYRWKPLQKKYRVIETEMIQGAEIRRTPMFNYGFGWFPGLGMFYNTHNGPGVQFYLQNGKRIFFSSKDTEQLNRAVQQLISTNRKTGMREF